MNREKLETFMTPIIQEHLAEAMEFFNSMLEKAPDDQVYTFCVLVTDTMYINKAIEKPKWKEISSELVDFNWELHGEIREEQPEEDVEKARKTCEENNLINDAILQMREEEIESDEYE